MNHACFEVSERRLLLATPGLGPRAVARLEEVGLNSISQLQLLGAEGVAREVSKHLGSGAWLNRRRALARVIDRASTDMSSGDVGQHEVASSATGDA